MELVKPKFFFFQCGTLPPYYFLLFSLRKVKKKTSAIIKVLVNL